MLYVIAAAAIAILGLIAALQIYKSRARRHEAELRRQKERAELAEMVSAAKQQTEDRIREVETKHRERQAADEAAIKLGDRGQFDSDW